MPIIIPRTGDTAEASLVFTQEQKEMAWAFIIKAWAQAHPEEFKTSEKKEMA